MKYLILFIFLSTINLASAGFCEVDEVLADFPTVLTEQEDRFFEILDKINFCSDSKTYGKIAKTVSRNTQATSWYIKELQKQLQKHYQPNHKLYQIGEKWNRSELSLVHDRKTYENLVAVGSASGVFLGNAENLGIIATNDHVIGSKKCVNLKISFPSNSKLVSCKKIIRFNNVDFDFAIILIDKQNIEPLQVIRNPKKKIQFYTAGRGISGNEAQVFLEESSTLCRKLFTIEGGEGTGCDVSSGDSGSPVFDIKTNQVYALVNATNSMIFSYSDEEYLEMSNDKKYLDLLKEQSSMITPFYLLKTKVNHSSLDPKDKRIVKCILKAGCLK